MQMQNMPPQLMFPNMMSDNQYFPQIEGPQIVVEGNLDLSISINCLTSNIDDLPKKKGRKRK